MIDWRATGARDAKKIRKSFPTLAAAKAWRQDSAVALRKGTMRAPSSITVREAATAWVTGARDGTIRNRSGHLYKPSAIRGYSTSLRLRILPTLGGAKLSEVTRMDLQDHADRWLADGLDASTIRNTLMPLRAIYRRALARGEVAVNPTSGLEPPAVEGRRDRIVAPDEATKLLAVLPEAEQAVWAAALFAGLRRGELMALRWCDVDLARGVIRVERAWDPKEGVYVDPKSRAGRRAVPVAAILRDYLTEHKATMRRDGEDLVFGRTATRPFDAGNLTAQATRAWGAAELQGLTLHEARHTFASLMIAAGVNTKALSTYMGHASVTITYDRYGHLMPGNEDEAAQLAGPTGKRIRLIARDGVIETQDARVAEQLSRRPAAAGRTCPPRQRDRHGGAAASASGVMTSVSLFDTSAHAEESTQLCSWTPPSR